MFASFILFRFFLYCEMREINVSRKCHVIRYTEILSVQFQIPKPRKWVPPSGRSLPVQVIIASKPPQVGYYNLCVSGKIDHLRT